jgi:phosphoserine phosphatase RsbU/P
MKIKFNSISVKIGLLYIFLAIFNMSFFSMMIYENQIDLISENTKFHSIELTDSLISSVRKFSEDLAGGAIFKVKNRDDMIKEIAGIIGKKAGEFIMFTYEGAVLYKSGPDFKLEKSDMINGIRAVTNMDFTGKRFYSHIDDEKYEISFYIPMKVTMIGEFMLFIKLKMKDIGDRLADLYRLITVIIILIAIFHIIFGMILIRLFVKPIQSLHEKSVMISAGNLSARSDLKSDDEIGSLSDAFNMMADSIQKQITTLKSQKELIDLEMDIAGDVQKIIYPQLSGSDMFNVAVFHKAFSKVSGDYYDIFPIGKSSIGFLIADVSGHGVPAALITMMIKEVFATRAPSYPKPSDLLQKVNVEVSDMLAGYETLSCLFFSTLYIIVDDNGRLSFTNAGHLDGMVVRREDGSISHLKSNGFPIGLMKIIDSTYETEYDEVRSGDKIVLMTDGIVEARNSAGEDFGVKRIKDLISANYTMPCETIKNAIIDELSRHADINNLIDDATLFIIEIK